MSVQSSLPPRTQPLPSEQRTSAPSERKPNVSPQAAVLRPSTLVPDYLQRLPYAQLQSLRVAPAAPAPSTSSPVKAGIPPLAGALSAPIVARSAEVSARIFSTWADPKAAVVYNFDMELDDQQRLAHLLTTWMAESPDRRAQMVLVAAQRTGGDDTFAELVAQAAFLTAVPDSEIKVDGRAGTAAVGPITIVRGGPLKSTDAQSRSSATEAARRVTSALGDRNFVWHNNTSETLFAAIPSEVQARCQAHVCTCDVILTPKGPIKGANYRWDPEAYTQSVDACGKLSVPFVSVHGSTLGFGRQTLSELPHWAQILRARVVDPRGVQGQIRFTMQQVFQWTGRIYGAVAQQEGQAVAHYLQGLVDTHTVALSAEIRAASMQAWTAKPCRASTYPAEDCTLDSAGKRARAIPENLGCPINNTIGDYAAAVLDGPTAPPGMLFLPLAVDFGGGPARTPVGIAMEESANAPLVAVNADETDLLAVHKAAQHRAESGALAGGASGKAVIDTDLASEWTAYSKVMMNLLEATLELASKKGPEASALQSHLASALTQLREGAMTAACGDIKA